MPRVFIFAQQVKEIIKSGKKEIEIPANARISAAAAELIKDHKLKIKTATGPDTTAPAVARAEDKPSQKKPAPRQNKPSEAVSAKTSTEKQIATDDEISDEDLETLVNRVIERFKQIKGIAPAPSAQKKAPAKEPQPAPADDDDLIICRCEEITKGEIKDAIRNGMQTVSGIKRITRAGMGLCQGQTCQRLVTQIIAEELGKSTAEIEPTTARGPVRPLRLAVYANR